MTIDVPEGGGRPHLSAAALDRPRIHALFDTAAQLTVVRAVHGAGKTTAIAAWDRRGDGDAVWIRARARDTGASDLAARISRQMAGAGIRSDAAADTEAGTWSTLSEALANSPARVIVLDDAGGVSSRDAQELVRALAHAPHIRLVVAADRVTFFESPAAALYVDRTIIGPNDLMFDLGEIARFLEVDHGVAERLHRTTGGLPVALRAIAESHRPKQRIAFSTAARDVVDDYLHLQFADAAHDDGFLAALARMSTADAIDHGTSVALSSDPRGEAILDEAASLGFGTWSDAGLFSFTPPLRSFLQREMRRSFSTELPELRSAAAREALRRGAPHDALRLAVDADDLPLAAHVVLVGWYELLERHGRAVIETLGSLPSARLKDQPLLVMLLAICYLGTKVRRLRGLQLLRAAIASADSPRGAVSELERLYIWTAQSVALRLVGWNRRSSEVAVRALRLLTEMPESDWEPYRNAIPRVCTQLGLCLFYAGHGRSAIEAWAFAAALASARNSPSAFHSVALIAGAHALDGNMPEAEQYARIIREGDWDARLLNGYQGTFYRVAEALLALEDGDVAAASAHVSAFDPHRETSEHWLVMASVETRVLLEGHAPEAGLERLESLVAARGKEASRTVARQRLAASRIHLHLARGSDARAKHIWEQDAAGDGYESVVLAARIALADGRPFDALRLLSRTDSVAPNARLRAEAAAITAAATIRTAGPDAASRPLRVLDAVLDDRRLRTPLTYLPPDDLIAVGELLGTREGGTAPESSIFPPRRRRPRLSGRERVVLRALHSSEPLPGIADELGVSVNTIKTQLRSLYRKLDVPDRASAISRSHELRLLDSDG